VFDTCALQRERLGLLSNPDTIPSRVKRELFQSSQRRQTPVGFSSEATRNAACSLAGSGDRRGVTGTPRSSRRVAGEPPDVDGTHKTLKMRQKLKRMNKEREREKEEEEKSRCDT